MKIEIFGLTASGLPIMSYTLGHTGPNVLILGGVHGNEPEGVAAAFGLLEKYAASFTHELQLTIVPQFNLDGVLKHNRKNAQNVDLNRNLPTKDWTKNIPEEKYYPGPKPNSEPENQHLVKWIDQKKPKLVMSLHSWNPMLNTNGKCRPEADIISKITGYIIKDDIGYPTPGSLGTYCGLERDIPTLTYEIERGLDFASIAQIHVYALHESLKVTAGRFQ